MTNLAHPRLAGAALIAAPVLLMASTVTYLSAGGGMNEGEAAGAVQVWAMIAFAVVAVSLARLLEAHSPRRAAALLLAGLAGAAGGVGYGIDSVQAALFGGGSVQDTTSAAAPFALQLPGLLFPLSLIGLGLSLARAGLVPRWSGLTLAAGALLFPLSRIPDVAALALASDALLVAALVPLGWVAFRQPTPDASPTSALGAPPGPVPAGR